MSAEGTKEVARERSRAGPAALAVVTLGAAVLCAVFVNVAASHRGVRIDLTTAGQHRLSEASRRVVERLDGTHRVVLAVDGSRADRAVLERVRDVMDAFRAESARGGGARRVEAAFIDLSASDGTARAGELIETLRAADAAGLAEAARVGELGAGALERAATDLRELGGALERLRGAIGEASAGAANNRGWAEQRAAMCRVLGDELAGVAAAAREELSRGAGGGGAQGGGLIVGYERVIGPAGAGLRKADQLLGSVASDAGSLASALDGALGGGGVSERDAAEIAGRVARGARAGRDAAAAAGDACARWRPPDALLAARAVEAGEAMLVLGPSRDGAGEGAGVNRASIVRVEPSELLPDAGALARAGVSAAGYAGERAEGLIAAALRRLADPAQPIVVLAHGEAQRGLVGSALTTRMVERLAGQGIDVVEWAAAVDAGMPSLSEVDPSGLRPVVIVTVSPDTTAGSSGAGGGASGAERARALAAAVGAEVDRAGAVRGVVLSLGPSVFLGDDPLAGLARGFGVEAATARPLLQEVQGPGGREVRTELVVVGGDAAGERAGDGGHVLAGAMEGERVLLPWAVGLKVGPAAGGGAAAVLSADVAGLWGESQWLGLWQTPRAQRGLRPELLPRLDSARDVAHAGGVVVAAAAEREGGSSGGARLVVVGSNGWMLDPVAEASETIDGRVVRSNRGNAVLLEGAVRWAAGQDELVGSGGAAGATPTIRALSAGELSAVRWGVVLGVPLGVLLAGLAWRLLRG